MKIINISEEPRKFFDYRRGVWVILAPKSITENETAPRISGVFQEFVEPKKRKRKNG
jgi:hypothetical protein